MVNFTIDQIREMMDHPKDGKGLAEGTSNTTGECNSDYLFSLIDQPGHVDFSAAITASSSEEAFKRDNLRLLCSPHVTTSRQALEAWLGIKPQEKAKVTNETKDCRFTKGCQRKSKSHMQNSR